MPSFLSYVIPQILLVDDDLVERSLISVLLEINDVNVIEAENGKEALTSAGVPTPTDLPGYLALPS